MHKHGKEKSRTACASRQEGWEEVKVGCAVSMVAERREVVTAVAAAAAWEMCVKPAAAGRRCRAPLYCPSAWCCRLRGGATVTTSCVHKMLLFASPSPSPPKKKITPALLFGSEIIFFVIFFLLLWAFRTIQQCIYRIWEVVFEGEFHPAPKPAVHSIPRDDLTACVAPGLEGFVAGAQQPVPFPAAFSSRACH